MLQHHQNEMHFLAQVPLEPNAEAVADDQHPDQEFRINRGSADVAVERGEVLAQIVEIKEPSIPHMR